MKTHTHSLSLSSMLNEYTLIYTYPSLKYFNRCLLKLRRRIFSTLPTKRVTIYTSAACENTSEKDKYFEVCGCQRQLLCELYCVSCISFWR